jgi:hypothetical protein
LFGREMNPTWWKVLAIGTSTALLCAQSLKLDVLKNDKWDRSILIRTVVVAPQFFGQDAIRKLFFEMLDAEKESYRIIKIEAFTSRDAPSINCKCATDRGLKRW